jgi:hypothetical protein
MAWARRGKQAHVWSSLLSTYSRPGKVERVSILNGLSGIALWVACKLNLGGALPKYFLPRSNHLKWTRELGVDKSNLFWFTLRTVCIELIIESHFQTENHSSQINNFHRERRTEWALPNMCLGKQEGALPTVLLLNLLKTTLLTNKITKQRRKRKNLANYT